MTIRCGFNVHVLKPIATNNARLHIQTSRLYILEGWMHLFWYVSGFQGTFCKDLVVLHESHFVYSLCCHIFFNFHGNNIDIIKCYLHNFKFFPPNLHLSMHGFHHLLLHLQLLKYVDHPSLLT